MRLEFLNEVTPAREGRGSQVRAWEESTCSIGIWNSSSGEEVLLSCLFEKDLDINNEPIRLDLCEGELHLLTVSGHSRDDSRTLRIA